MKVKLSKLILFLFFAFSLSFIGWNNSNQDITDFYYYKDAPFKLNKKTDYIFIKLKEPVKSEKFREALASLPNALMPSAFDEKETKHFIELSNPLVDAELIALANKVSGLAEVVSCSPVFSPDDGKTLIGVEDEIIVQFKPSTSASEMNDIIAANSLQMVSRLDLTGGNAFIYKVNKYESAIDVANRIYLTGKTVWSEPNLYFTNLLCFTPNDTYYPQQWSIKNTGNNIPDGIAGTIDCDMDVDSAWDITLGISAVKIAVIDTGVDTLHEDLAANMVIGTGYNFYNNTPGAYDDGNHGTACAGIIAAVGNNSMGVSGVAPNCKIIPVKWLSSSGNGNYAGATSATIYAYQKGAWVLSNSWGFVGGSSSALDAAINDAATLGRNGKGSLFVVASGNENGTMRYPAISHPKVLVVGGISPCNQRKSPSSCDNESWWGASYGANLDIVSPCVKIYTTDRMGSVGYTSGNYDPTFNGTSSATPNTAGVCALVFSIDSSQTWDTVRARIDLTAEKVGAYTYNQPGPRTFGLWNNEMGYGKVNAYNVVKYTNDRLGPVITHTPLTNTENLTGPYVVNCTITPSGSAIDPTKTKVMWSRNNTIITDSVLMTNTSGTNWTANIPGNGTSATYRYYIKTADALNRVRTAPYGAPANLYSFLASSDITKPVIVHTPLGNCPKVNWPATVTANVTDNLGLDSVWVRWYKNNTATGVKHKKLVNTSGSTFTAPFNSDTSQVSYNDSIYYRIIAQDNSSNHNKDSTALYSFKIIAVANPCIGTGTTAIGYPFYTFYMDSRTDMLYTAAEIIAGGGAAGVITKVGFNVTTAASQVMNGFKIRMQQTTATSVTTFTSTGWTTVFDGTYTVPGTGWQFINLQTPFTWNGTSNLLINICFNNSSYTSNTTILGSAATNRVVHNHADLSSGDGCQDITSPGSGYTALPNLCMQINLYVGNQTIQTTTVPKVFALEQNYPNPFNPSTSIKYSVPKQSLVKMVVYDLLGREVATLVNEMKQPGNYEAAFDASTLASGVYFYKMEARDFTDVKKMVLIK